MSIVFTRKIKVQKLQRKTRDKNKVSINVKLKKECLISYDITIYWIKKKSIQIRNELVEKGLAYLNLYFLSIVSYFKFYGLVDIGLYWFVCVCVSREVDMFFVFWFAASHSHFVLVYFVDVVVVFFFLFSVIGHYYQPYPCADDTGMLP